MASSDLETKAKEAFIDDHFELAVDLYTQAIALNPNHAELYADRAQANLKLENFTEAVADATRAIELGPSAKAYLRKGTACFKLEEYQTAKAALEAGASLAPGDSRFTNLIKECDQHIAEEASDIPIHSLEKTTPTNVVPMEVVQPVDDLSEQVIVSAKPKYRHEFYQKPEEVVVTIFAKGIPAENVSVEFGEQILSVSISVPGEDAYHYQPRLFGKIITSKCRYDVLSTKVEIRLAKAESVHWTSLEFSKESRVPQRVNALVTGSQRPTYPSSKPNRVDWDKLEAEVKKEFMVDGQHCALLSAKKRFKDEIETY
ncbi:protein SGT1 homolog isoform X2 [Alnus glutinosa]|uniref:protein SGT1 homolog isoform X2 n=1 Tax=Alnus glutinosa TaxID=3517 RepID=UPI002D794C46|nr:protein SGT1 homolog isoform X2 [Alnus glutinosa]